MNRDTARWVRRARRLGNDALGAFCLRCKRRMPQKLPAHETLCQCGDVAPPAEILEAHGLLSLIERMGEGIGKAELARVAKG